MELFIFMGCWGNAFLHFCIIGMLIKVTGMHMVVGNTAWLQSQTYHTSNNNNGGEILKIGHIPPDILVDGEYDGEYEVKYPS